METTETLDFLKELVQAIPDPSAGGTIDFEAENAESKKKRGKGRRAPADPNAPKRRRKKKGEEEPGDDAPVSGAKKEEPDEDVEMQDDQDEYDDDDDDARPATRGPSSSYRPRSPSDGEEEDKPFIPRD